MDEKMDEKWMKKLKKWIGKFGMFVWFVWNDWYVCLENYLEAQCLFGIFI